MRLHFRMRVLHAVMIRSYIKGFFVEGKETKGESEGEFSLAYCSKNIYLWYEEHQGRSLRVRSGIKTLSEQFGERIGTAPNAIGRNGNREHAS